MLSGWGRAWPPAPLWGWTGAPSRDASRGLSAGREKVAMGRERALPSLTTLTQQVAAVVLFLFVKNNRDSRAKKPPPRAQPRILPTPA